MNRRLFTVISAILTILSLIFIGNRLVKYREYLLSIKWDSATVLILLAGALCYMGACLLLSTAWKMLLEKFGQKEPGPGVCHFVYARTQIAKYIPGNVFQIVGRHMLGNKLGFRHEPLTYAAFYEMIGVVCSSSLLAVVGFIVIGYKQAYLSTSTILTVFFIAIALTFMIAKTLPLIAQRLGHKVSQLNTHDIIRKIVPIYGLYVLFFGISGFIMYGTVQLVSPVNGWSIAIFSIAIFSLSWLAGFITPGSPSGLGVREAVLVLTLGKVVGENNSLLIALLLRIVTISGDILYFLLVGYFFRLHKSMKQWSQSVS